MKLLNLGWGLLILFAGGCATTSSGNSEATSGDRVTSSDARTNVARLLSEAASLMSEKPALAAQKLNAAWSLSPQLIDDRILRASISKLPPDHTSPTLKRVARVAQAQDAFADNSVDKVRQLLAERHETYDLTEARRLVLLSLVQVSTDPSAAKLSLTQVANGELLSASGIELQNMARTTAASIDFDQERLVEAMKTYLRVSEESAYWPTARTAISWAQFQLRKYERALAGLQLLPGGIAGAPDRVLLAAICYHHLGQIEKARDVIAQAAAHQGAWFDDAPSAEAVLAAIRDETTTPGVVTSVAWHPPIRLLGREINATDTLRATLAADMAPAVDVVDAYRAKAWQKFEEMVTRKTQGAREAAKVAYKKLTILAPQLK